MKLTRRQIYDLINIGSIPLNDYPNIVYINGVPIHGDCKQDGWFRPYNMEEVLIAQFGPGGDTLHEALGEFLDDLEGALSIGEGGKIRLDKSSIFFSLLTLLAHLKG